MVFEACFNVPGSTPPMRAYVHEVGFSLFGKLDRRHSEVQDPRLRSLLGVAHHLDEILEQAIDQQKLNIEFLIALLWGDVARNELVADLIGFSDMRHWPGNPDITIRTLRDGMYRSQQTGQLCGDGLILLGQEELHRRGQRDLRSYAHTTLFMPPSIRSDDYRVYRFPEYPHRSLVSDLPRERSLPEAPRPA